MATTTLQEQFGNIDIYVFDQLLRGRITAGMRVFDAGCGGGRNLVYMLRNEFDVAGNDQDANAIAQVRALAESLAPGRAHDFRVEPIESTSFPDDRFDVVIASAVLHFARDAAHFESMLRQLWRVLKPGGVFFTRLASTIGIEGIRPLGDNRYRLPDGSDRYLVDAAAIQSWTDALGGALIDPIKTTVVDGQRSMTTWVASRRR
jgi:SAM-dependent methyltransferase